MRIANEDVRHGKMMIPKGVSLFASVNELHYNENVYRDAECFRPERFLPENRTPAMMASFQGFGAGPRNCLGMGFAMMEMKLALAKLLTKYRVTADLEPYHEASIKTIPYPFILMLSEGLKCKLDLL